jgi:hypothetical protein
MVEAVEPEPVSSEDGDEQDRASIACDIELDATELVKSSGIQSPGSWKNTDGLAKGSNKPEGDEKRVDNLSLR